MRRAGPMQPAATPGAGRRMQRMAPGNGAVAGISVVIPVFNAAAYLEQSVRSALDQPETAEVLIVEDGSRDDSLDVGRRLACLDPRIRLLRHRGGRNLGVSASRNLGIRSTACEYIALLDADDYYLAGRFSTASGLLSRQPEVDGVYEAVGVVFESPAAEAVWRGLGREDLTTLDEPVPPGRLFETMRPIGRSGHVHVNGLTARRRLFDHAGLFDPCLRLHQDTAFFLRAAAKCVLVAGRLSVPVAMRRVYASNRILAHRSPAAVYRNYSNMWVSVWRDLRRGTTPARRELMMRRILRLVQRPYRWQRRPICTRFQVLLQLAAMTLQAPSLMTEPSFRSAWVRAAIPVRARRHVARCVLPKLSGRC